jgi:cytidylate kinase
MTLKIVQEMIKNQDKTNKIKKISLFNKNIDSFLLNRSKLTKRACFLKQKKITDRKTNI